MPFYNCPKSNFLCKWAPPSARTFLFPLADALKNFFWRENFHKYGKILQILAKISAIKRFWQVVCSKVLFADEMPKNGSQKEAILAQNLQKSCRWANLKKSKPGDWESGVVLNSNSSCLKYQLIFDLTLLSLRNFEMFLVIQSSLPWVHRPSKLPYYDSMEWNINGLMLK